MPDLSEDLEKALAAGAPSDPLHPAVGAEPLAPPIDAPAVDTTAALQAKLLAAKSDLASIEARVKEWFEATVAYAPKPHLLALEEHFRQQWPTLAERLHS